MTNKPQNSKPTRVTFSGEYLTFNDVFKAYPSAKSYHSSSSMQQLEMLAKQKLNSLSSNTIPESSWANGRDNIVLTLLTTLFTNKTLRIFDIGGGLGSLFTSIKISCPQIKVDYTILELPETVIQGNKLFSEFSEIKFVTEIPQKDETFDICLFASSLQYFEDYKGIIQVACIYKPQWIILVDHPMTNSPSFVCAQVNMSDRVIPIMVFNLLNIIQIFGVHGYNLKMKSISHYPFHNFSNYENDLSKTNFYNLIFSR